MITFFRRATNCAAFGGQILIFPLVRALKSNKYVQHILGKGAREPGNLRFLGKDAAFLTPPLQPPPRQPRWKTFLSEAIGQRPRKYWSCYCSSSFPIV